MSRRYVEHGRPIDKALCPVGPDGVQRDLAGRIVAITRPCEHCDGEHSTQVRVDDLRGFVCPACDSALDEMLGEGDFARKKAVP